MDNLCNILYPKKLSNVDNDAMFSNYDMFAAKKDHCTIGISLSFFCMTPANDRPEKTPPSVVLYFESRDLDFLNTQLKDGLTSSIMSDFRKVLSRIDDKLAEINY